MFAGLMSLCSSPAAAMPEPMPFRQYALDQAAWKQTAERAAVEAWWVEKYAQPVTPLELPTDRQRGAVKSFRGKAPSARQ